MKRQSMSTITYIIEAIGRSISDLASDPAVTLAGRAEALSRIRASCEYHVRILAVEAELIAFGDFLATNRTGAGEVR